MAHEQGGLVQLGADEGRHQGGVVVHAAIPVQGVTKPSDTFDAQDFRDGFVPGDTDMSVDDPAIPGANDFDSTTAKPDGSFDHGVMAAKGRQVMVIDYVTGTADNVLDVPTLASQQYAKLSG